MSEMVILSKMDRFYSMKKLSSRVRSECTVHTQEFQMSAEQVQHLLSSSKDRMRILLCRRSSRSGRGLPD